MIIRVLAFLAGAVAVVWGSVIAGIAGQPIPLIAAGILVILMAWVGSEWEEIAAKFGDSEVRVKRAVAETADKAIRAVSEVEETAAKAEGLSDEDRDAIALAANRARADLMISLWQLRKTWDHPHISVGDADREGRRPITVSGTGSPSKAGPEWVISVHAPDELAKITVSDGIYQFPSDWGLPAVPERARLQFWSGRIKEDGFRQLLFIQDVELG